MRRTCRTRRATGRSPTRHRHRVRAARPAASTRSPAPTATACRSSTSRARRSRGSRAIYDCGVSRATSRSSAAPTCRAARSRPTRPTPTATARPPATAKPQALGFDVLKADGTGRNGTFILEVTDPLHPKTIAFAEVPQGSHNQTVHPSGKYMYNSNSDLITSPQPAIEVHRHDRPVGAQDGRRAGAADAPRARHRVARHLVQQGRHARLLGRALAGRDHRHARSRRTRRSSRASWTRRSTSGTSSSRSRSPTSSAASASS